MKNKMSGALAALLLVSSAYAADGVVSFDQKGSLAQIVSQVKAANPGADIVPLPGNPKVAKEWTVMVFVNAKNNLEAFGIKDVNEMEMIGSDDNINIVAELGRIKGYSSDDGDWTGSRRYLVQKDADPTKITSPIVMEILKSDMGSWEYMADFAKWAMELYPAKHYALIVWNHGSGWKKDLTFADRGISYDDETGAHISTPQLRQAMEKIGKTDILGMDACLMQMAEVVYEIRNSVDYIVASEETEPGDGYTYNTWLGPLTAKPGMTGAELGTTMVDSYTDHYQSIGQSGTQSLVKAASLGKLIPLVDAWTDAVIAANDIEIAKKAKNDVQDFFYASNKDLYHYVKLVSEATANPEVSAKGKELMNFLQTDLIMHNRATGTGYVNAFGLAIYLPVSYAPAYDTLMWTNESKWDDFQKWILK